MMIMLLCIKFVSYIAEGIYSINIYIIYLLNTVRPKRPIADHLHDSNNLTYNNLQF